jgi:hypothetical protein
MKMTSLRVVERSWREAGRERSTRCSMIRQAQHPCRCQAELPMQVMALVAMTLPLT